MEKQRFKSRAESFRRLLIYFVLFFSLSSLHAKWISPFELRNLSFAVSAGQELVTNTEIKFFVEIPGVAPSEVEILTPKEVENVSFTSSRRIQSDLNNEGTVVEMWFSFAKKGTYHLPPLSVNIQGSSREIKFNPVSIKFNPKEQQPVIIVQFDNGLVLSSDLESLNEFKKKVQEFTLTAGKKISFTVYIQFGVQLISFNWDIPKDSIFTQTKTYPIIENQIADTNKTDDLIPVADFEWMPLVPGVMEFPSIRITVSSFRGYKSEISLPDFSINILENTEEEIIQNDPFYQDAFAEIKKNVPEKKEIIITKADCEKIAALRIAERHSLFSGVRKERIELEQSLNLPSNQKEFKTIFIFIALFCVLICIILFIFFLRKKKLYLNIIASVLLLSSIFMFTGIILKAKNEHAVSMGCTLYSIPEIDAESKTELLPGSYVQIKEKNGDWLYVNLGESGGWCKKENFIIIK